MDDNILSYPAGGIKTGFMILNIIKNIFYVLAVFLSFSLWLASTVNTPKRLEEVESRLGLLNATQNRIEGRLELVCEDLRFIKNNLNNK